jgi:hypothetical protein
MANRSDYQRAVLPRHIKKFLIMGNFDNAHEYGAMKRLFITAHAINRSAKNKRSALQTEGDSSSDE